MAWMVFREPVSALSHLLWMLMAIPATWLLMSRCRGNAPRQMIFLIYGVCIGLCYAGSAFYHSVRLPEEIVEGICQRLDFMGIYLLIAGTVTPPAILVLRGRWRQYALVSSWGLASLGIVLRLTPLEIPRGISNGIYLGMGWGIVLCYFELQRKLPPGAMLLPVTGGVLYSIGAILNWVHWPRLWPGIFSAHEVFHLFVMAGTVSHYLFMLTVMVPYRPVWGVVKMTVPVEKNCIPSSPNPNPV